MTDLRARFAALLRRLGADGDPYPLADAVLGGWAEPGRHYHDVEHLHQCLAELDGAPAVGADRDRVEAALWFHDAIYDPHADDNEDRSAEWARAGLAAVGVSSIVADDIARLVLLTRHAGPAPDAAGRLLCDIDLAVLGRDPETFDAYDRGIRAEYEWVPEPDYRARRRVVLAGLLARSPLFQTIHFQRRYAAAARENLGRALARLAEARM
jgi:predicted metal-dependent HD superfamily phosphohydrolase